MYVIKDYDLINDIFESFDNYIRFCKLNEDELKIDIDKLRKMKVKFEFTYVDDNIDKYLEKGSKKVLSE